MEQVLNKKEIAAAKRIAKQQAAEQKQQQKQQALQDKIKVELDKILEELKAFKIPKVTFLRNKIARKKILFGQYDNLTAMEVMKKMQDFTQELEDQGEEIFELCFSVDNQYLHQYDENLTYGFFAHWKSYETTVEYKERMERLLSYEKNQLITQLAQYKQLQKKFGNLKK